MTDDITAVLKRSFNEAFEIFDDVQQRFSEFAKLIMCSHDLVCEKWPLADYGA